MSALVLVLAVVVYVRTDNVNVADVCFLGAMVAAALVAWLGVRRWPRERRLVPCLIATGITLNTLAEITLVALYRSGMDIDVSLADVGWLSSYIFLCAALWVVLSRSRGDGRADTGFVIDAVTIVVISVLVFWRFTIEAIVADDTLTPFVRTVWASYPVLDAVLLALVVRVFLNRRARAAIDPWFGVGAALWLAADVLYLLAVVDPHLTTAMAVAWMVAPLMVARAAWRVRDPGTEAAAQVTAPSGWVAAMLIAVCPLIVPPTLEFLADLRGQTDQPWQLFIGTGAVMALALVRIGRLVRSEHQAQLEMVAARDAALAASQTKSLFLANMSHEIRTPLTTVVAVGELLTVTPLDEKQVDLLGRLRRCSQQLLSLVEGLLDLSRIEAGRATVHNAELDIRALVDDVLDAHRPRAEQQGIELVCEMDPRLPHTLVADRTRVFQVLNNLVDNAMKFTHEGRVRLSVLPDDSGATPGGHGVWFSVTDTGIGIPEEDRATVFESFRQVDGSATRRYGGTGLGLAICKEVTELMGGTIRVQSELGVGSTFTVWLPIGPPPVSEDREPSPSRPTSTPEPIGVGRDRAPI